MKKQMQLWDWPVNFCQDKEDLRHHPDFEKTYTVYMINRILSMSPRTCGLAMFMSLYPNIPKAQHFAFLNSEIDREYIYFNYKKYEPKFHKKVLYSIREYFYCNEERAVEIASLLSKKQAELILDSIERRDQTKVKKLKKKEK